MALRDYRRSLVKRRQRKGHRTFAHRRRDLIWVPGGNLTGQIIKLPRATAHATRRAAVRHLKTIGNFVHTPGF